MSLLVLLLHHLFRLKTSPILNGGSKEDERLLLTLVSSCCGSDKAADAALLAIVISKIHQKAENKKNKTYFPHNVINMALTDVLSSLP